MQHPNILELSRSALLIIDVQEAFRASIKDFDKLGARIAIAARGAQLLNLPIIVTEQYPKGLGHTAAEITAVLPGGTNVLEKTSFSSCGAQQFFSKLQERETKHEAERIGQFEFLKVFVNRSRRVEIKLQRGATSIRIFG